jgi:hypothetical protein
MYHSFKSGRYIIYTNLVLIYYLKYLSLEEKKTMCIVASILFRMHTDVILIKNQSYDNIQSAPSHAATQHTPSSLHTDSAQPQTPAPPRLRRFFSPHDAALDAAACGTLHIRSPVWAATRRSNRIHGHSLHGRTRSLRRGGLDNEKNCA